MRFPWQKSADRKSLADPDSWLLSLFGGGAITDSGVTVTIDTALRVPAVQAAIRVIAEAAASLNVRVVAIDDAGIETDARSHPAWTVPGAPNDWSDRFDLIRALMVDALTRDAGGLAFVNWIDGKPAEIIKYRPGVIQVDLTADTGEPRYMIGSIQQPAQNIVHLRNTFDRSPVALAAQAIGTAIVMSKHAARLFGKGARPGGVLSTPKPLGDEGVKKMLAGWAAAMDGSDNAGKTAILWDGATWSQMTLNSVDAQFQQLWLFVLQEIARAFNLPASMIGDLSRATWSNSEQMGREFLVMCLEPWLQALEGALRRALFTAEERPHFAVRFDRDDLTRADIGQRATAYNSLISGRVINPNEARKWEGLPPYTGGEAYVNPNITAPAQPTA